LGLLTGAVSLGAERTVGTGSATGKAGDVAGRSARTPLGVILGDLCADAVPILEGVTSFTTVGATTDGPSNPPGACNDSGENQTHNDIWFAYTATATGNLLVDTCEEYGGSAGYDSDLVIYDGCDCGALALLDCNDDAYTPCGSNTYHSAAYVPVVQGNCYLIRVGGWSAADSGIGDLELLSVLPEPGLLDQLSTTAQVGTISDVSCPGCASGQQILAEDFVVLDGETVWGVEIEGGYFPDDLATFDIFTVKIYDDAGGAPGAPQYSYSPGSVTVTHTATGDTVVGTTVYRIELRLPSAAVLAPGTYWVTVYNDTTGSTDTFYVRDSLTDLPRATSLHHAGSGTLPPGEVWDGSGAALSLRLLGCYASFQCDDGNENGVRRSERLGLRQCRHLRRARFLRPQHGRGGNGVRRSERLGLRQCRHLRRERFLLFQHGRGGNGLRRSGWFGMRWSRHLQRVRFVRFQHGPGGIGL
jgi:hypothetical protein